MPKSKPHGMEPPATSGKRRVPGAERRKQILDAARAVFIRSGLSGSRTREIAQEAGVNEATLWVHFASKEDLFDTAVFEPLEEAMKTIRMEFASSDKTVSDPQEQIRLQKEGHKHFLIAISRVYPLLTTALHSDSERGRRFYEKHLSPWFQTINTTQRASLGGFPRKSINPETVSIVTLGAYMAIMMDRSFRGQELDVDLAVQEVSELLNFGLFQQQSS